MKKLTKEISFVFYKANKDPSSILQTCNNTEINVVCKISKTIIFTIIELKIATTDWWWQSKPTRIKRGIIISGSVT